MLSRSWRRLRIVDFSFPSFPSTLKKKPYACLFLLLVFFFLQVKGRNTKTGAKGESKCWREREREKKEREREREREKRRGERLFPLPLSLISRLALGRRRRGKLEAPVLPSGPRSSSSSSSSLLFSISVVAHLEQPSPPPFPSRYSLPAVERHEERTGGQTQYRPDSVRRGVSQRGPPWPPPAVIAQLLQRAPEKGQESSGEEALLSSYRGRRKRRRRSRVFYDRGESEKPGTSEREAERDVLELVRGDPRIFVLQDHR